MVVQLVSPTGRYDLKYLRNYAELHPRRRSRASPAWARSRPSAAATTRCGSGSTREKLASARHDGRRRRAGRCASRTCRSRPASSAARRTEWRRFPAADQRLGGRLGTRRSSASHRQDRRERRADPHPRRRPRRTGRLRVRMRYLSDAGRRSRSDLPGAGLERAADADDVRATMARLARNFPVGLEYRVVYDPTQFVRAVDRSRDQDAARGAAAGRLVVVLFLQTWRASIIPLAGGAGVDRRHLRGAADGSASRSTRCRCSAWCSRSASSSTTRSSWSRTSSATSRPALRRATPRTARWTRCPGPSSRSAGADRGVRADRLHRRLTGQFYRQFASRSRSRPSSRPSTR
jgi:hypothetical protein